MFSVPHTIAGNLDSSGHFSIAIPSNTNITPSLSSWDFQVCPIAKGNTTCFTQQSLTITGTTQDLSFVHPPAISIDLTHPAFPFVVAYSNAEITTAPVGGIYWDYTLNHYFVCESTNGPQIWYGACTLWKEFCLVGDGLCGGGSANAIYQHNGTLVGQQPKLNFIDNGSVTFTLANDGANSRVNVQATAAGGGSGCTLPGLDTGVLSEHPAGTCYDSVDWTWDDGVGKQNMQAGLSNIVGSALTFTFGTTNNLTGSSDATALGNNLTMVCQFCDAQGSNNSITAVGVGAAGNTKLYARGFNIALQGNSTEMDVHSYGNQNSVLLNSASTLLSVWQLGELNFIDADSGGASTTTINVVAQLGKQNSVQMLNPNATALNLTQVGLHNQIQDGINTISHAHQFGDLNNINVDQGSFLFTLGYDNTFTGVAGGNFQHAMAFGNVNQIVGTGAMSRIGAYGYGNTLTNCSDCFAFGENISQSGVNGTMFLGVSASPEAAISSGVFDINAWPMKQMQVKTFTGCTTGAGTYSECAVTFSWTKTFGDTNYGMVCLAHGTTNDSGSKESYIIYEDLSSPKTATQATVRMQNNRGSTPVSAVQVTCIGAHE